MAALETKQDKAERLSYNMNCPRECVSCKCCGTEYLFPCEYYDRYQRTQPDLGLFFIDHVEKGTHWSQFVTWEEWRELNVEIINTFLTGLCYYNTKCLFLSL